LVLEIRLGTKEKQTLLARLELTKIIGTTQNTKIHTTNRPQNIQLIRAKNKRNLKDLREISKATVKLVNQGSFSVKYSY